MRIAFAIVFSPIISHQASMQLKCKNGTSFTVPVLKSLFRGKSFELYST